MQFLKSRYISPSKDMRQVWVIISLNTLNNITNKSYYGRTEKEK